MKYLIITAIILSVALSATAQTISGVITYNRKTDWVSIMNKLPYMTEEDINRSMLNFGNRDNNKGTDYLLHFNENESLYLPKEKESDGQYSWKSAAYALQRDYKNKKVYDWIETLGKKYVIKDDIPKYKWKILNEIKEVSGYLCMKAETVDPVKNQIIHAWYSDAIMLNGGPEGYGGLPGMILELNINEGDAIITATKVDLTLPIGKLPVPKKIKGKEMDIAGYSAILKKYIDESIEGKRNPYWRIRY